MAPQVCFLNVSITGGHLCPLRDARWLGSAALRHVIPRTRAHRSARWAARSGRISGRGPRTAHQQQLVALREGRKHPCGAARSSDRLGPPLLLSPQSVAVNQHTLRLHTHTRPGALSRLRSKRSRVGHLVCYRAARRGQDNCKPCSMAAAQEDLTYLPKVGPWGRGGGKES